MNISNRIITASLAMCLIAFISGCNKLNDLVTFKMSYTSEVTVPSSLGINLPLDILTPPISSDAESQFSGNNTSKKLVKEIYLENVDISVNAPEDRDLSFLSSLHVYINADGLDEKLLASAENIPDNVGNTLSLTTSGEDFKEYIVQDTYSLRVKAVTDKVISEDVELSVKSGFQVKAGLLND